MTAVRMKWARWGWVAAVMMLAGCGNKAPDYTPSLTTAEEALKKCLDAWQAGEPAGVIPNTKPTVHVVDVGRKPDQRLVGYRILGETRGPSGRTFAVTLELENPNEQVKTQYIVVGIDPLWVFRQEDYELLAHWEHHMPPAEKSEADTATSKP